MGARPDTTWEQVPLDRVVEIRVHGVGGTPAREMLDDPHPIQVSGDRIAGMMRSTRHSPEAPVEAYSWGGLTGRSQVRALWLLVLPFALVNVAGWMNPRRDDAVHRGLIRLIGLSLTALYVLFAAVVAMDFVAYQCAGTPGCATASWVLIGVGQPVHDPARRAVLGAVFPLVVVLALAVLTRASRRRYEAWGRPGRRCPDDSDNPTERGLTDPSFWSGRAHADRLAQVHYATGLGIVALLLAATAQVVTASPVAAPLLWVSAVFLLLLVPLALVSRLRARLPRPMVTLIGGVLVIATGVAAWTGQPLPARPPRPLPGILLVFDAIITVLFTSVVLLVVAPAMLAIGRRILGQTPTEPAAPVSWSAKIRRRITPFAVCALAAVLVPAFLAGTALWVAQRLGTTASAGRPDAGSAAIVYPQPYEALAQAMVVAVLVGVVTAVTAALATGWRVDRTAWRRLFTAWLLGAVPDGARSARPERRWRRAVSRALRIPRASLAAVEWTGGTLAALITAAAFLYSGYWLAHVIRADDTGGYLDLTVLDTLPLPPLELSTWLLTSLPVLGAAVVRQGLRHPSARRRIAIAWDITTFWPRSFHPLAPPSYAERAVPELQTRLRRIWDAGGSVVLLAHSQGAVLATAAIAGLDPATPGLADRLAVVSYGNPIRRLYARYFPGYVDDELLCTVLGRPASWCNFYRDTDYVGHQMRPRADAPGRDIYLADPATDHYLPGDTLPEIRSHGERGYRRQVVLADHVAHQRQALAAAREMSRDGAKAAART